MKTLQTDSHLHDFYVKAAIFWANHWPVRNRQTYFDEVETLIKDLKTAESVDTFLDELNDRLKDIWDCADRFMGLYSSEQIAQISAIELLIDCLKSFQLRFVTGGSKSYIGLLERRNA